MEDILTWAAPAASIIAALMTASNLGAKITGAGFIVFTVGSLAWIGLGVASGNQALLWQNVVFTALNLFGIWRWLGRQAEFEDGGQHAADASETKRGESLFALSTVTSAAVIGRGGVELGKCVDAMARRASGRISYLVVAQGGVGGVGERLRRVEWQDAEADSERICLAMDRSRFEQLELLEKDKWPGR